MKNWNEFFENKENKLDENFIGESLERKEYEIKSVKVENLWFGMYGGTYYVIETSNGKYRIELEKV